MHGHEVVRIAAERERALLRRELLLELLVPLDVRLAGRHREDVEELEVDLERPVDAVLADLLERVQEAPDLVLLLQVPEELAERRAVCDARRHAVRRAALGEEKTCERCGIAASRLRGTHWERMCGITDK